MASKYNDEEKKRILQEKIELRKTVVEICGQYKISLPTYYQWKSQFEFNNKGIEVNSRQKNSHTNQDKYDTLKKLYIGLSEHNYQLAKLLEQ